MSIRSNRNYNSRMLIVVIPSILIGVTLLLIIVSIGMSKHRVGNEEQGYNWAKLLKKKETVIDWVNDSPEIYLITSSLGHKDYGDYLTVLREEEGSYQRVYDNHFEQLRPWKIRIGDVDGDETKEVITAVYKTAHYDKVDKNRLFLFHYEDGILIKKWTGSQFAGNWRDFYVYNLLPIPGDEIIFIEEAEGGRDKISIYYWFDFGFMKLAESEAQPIIKELFVEGDNRMRITYEDKDRGDKVLTVKEGKIVELVEEFED